MVMELGGLGSVEVGLGFCGLICGIGLGWCICGIGGLGWCVAGVGRGGWLEVVVGGDWVVSEDGVWVGSARNHPMGEAGP